MLLSLVTVLFVAPASAAETHSVQPGKAWRYRVFANLVAVDDIVTCHDGSVYATQNLAEGDGRVVRLRAGKAETIADDLANPRGLLVKKLFLYVTEQVNDGRVSRISLVNGERRVIENLYNPEHLAKLPDGDIVVTENGVNGRLMRLLKNGTVEIITGGLNSPDGLAVGRDGAILISESGTGRVLEYKDGVLNVVVDDLDEPGQIDVGPDGALWIVEQARPGRLLRLKDGALETILNGLSDPRGIALMENGSVLIAEQGKNRILIVEPKL